MSAAFSSVLAPFPAKRIASAGGVHPKTAQRWRDGTAEPSGSALLAMMSDDDLYAALMRAIGRADEAARQRAIAILTAEEP